MFFVTWFPTYLVTARGMTFIQAGLMTSLPYIGASAGVLVGGQISDTILKRTGSANLSRKLPIVGGMLLASTIVAANYVPAGSDGLVILIMSIAFFGQGMTNLGWTVVSDIAPKKLIGLTSGIFNFSANMAGIVTPLVIGIAFELTGSFVGPLVYIGVVALIGAFAYSVILGDIPPARDRRRELTDADRSIPAHQHPDARHRPRARLLRPRARPARRRPAAVCLGRLLALSRRRAGRASGAVAARRDARARSGDWIMWRSTRWTSKGPGRI